MTLTLQQKAKVKKIALNCVLGIILLFIAVAVLFPIYFVIITSFKSYSEYVSHPIGFRFSALQISNYTTFFSSNNMLAALSNSVIVVVVSVVCAVIFTALASFGMGVLKFRGASIIYFIAISTMFFTGEMTYVPLYMMYNKMGLLNTIGVLLVPPVIGLQGLGILLGSNFIKQIPHEIHEAAILDGAGAWQIFWRIDIIMLRPILAMVAIMSFQASWSEFFWPLITVMGNPSAYTLPLVITNLKASDATMFGTYTAGLTVMTVPIVLVYCFFSKYFMEGMTAGAVKG